MKHATKEVPSALKFQPLYAMSFGKWARTHPFSPVVIFSVGAVVICERSNSLISVQKLRDQAVR